MPQPDIIVAERTPSPMLTRRSRFLLALTIDVLVSGGVEAKPRDLIEVSDEAGSPQERSVSTPLEPPAVCVAADPDAVGGPAKLVAGFAFDQVSKGLAPAYGAGVHATLVAADLTTGRFGQGLALDGSASHARIEAPGWPSADFTYAVWVLPRRQSSWRTILEIQTPSSLGLELAIDASDRLEVWSSGRLRLRNGNTIPTDQWSHVTVTRRGQLITLFVNGVAQRAGRDGAPFDFGTCPALIGVDADVSCVGELNGFFAGVIDEVRVYDCALSPAAILALVDVPSDPASPVSRNGQLHGLSGQTIRRYLTEPPQWDVELLARIGESVTGFPTPYRLVQQFVDYGLLGGVWYGGVLFVLWVRAAQPEHAALRRPILLIAIGTIVAVLLTVAAGHFVSWPPPSAHPELAGLYPRQFPVNLNATSFPSQSTGLYAAVTAGLYSIRRNLGVCAWLGVLALVGLPRMYLGGHYATEILAGVTAGLAGYRLAVLLCSTRIMRHCESLFALGWSDWRRAVAEAVVFLWIFQIATECALAVWAVNGLFALAG